MNERLWRVRLHWRDEQGRGSGWETGCDLAAPDWRTALRLTLEWRGKSPDHDFTSVEVTELERT